MPTPNIRGLLAADPYLTPFADALSARTAAYTAARRRLLGGRRKLSAFATGHLYYGFHRTRTGMVFREWAPAARAVYLFGQFNNWHPTSHPLTAIGDGNWEIHLDKATAPAHGSLVKLRIVTADGDTVERIPTYIRRVVQQPDGHFDGQVWLPPTPYRFTHPVPTQDRPLLIYECHIGMATEEGKIGSFAEFTRDVLPHIAQSGYTAVQIMAVMEHPYYASFGYQVTNFFAVSSRFGTPEDLKMLIDTAHGLGLIVLLDVIHSHVCPNTAEGISRFDGTDYQFCHTGAKGDHPAWGTRLFDYAKPQVIHFLLSNLQFWMTEYRFDGFRFDGVTSMLYHDHGLGVAFTHYDLYFGENTDTDAVTYLMLANNLIHEVNPRAVTIAEDMSGMPGMAFPLLEGGIGFDYRLAMGAPDFWVKTVSKLRDEDWNMDALWYEMTTRRPQERNVGYCESHDQALVGDKTLMFWLADKDMYYHMADATVNDTVRRAMALHKMIRLTALTLAGEGYLNFMGNEFGHPEWIDFPREGNGNSFHYCRRQWSLCKAPDLQYRFLYAFDCAMLALTRGNLYASAPERVYAHNDDKVLAFIRGEYLVVLNFHTFATHTVPINLANGVYGELVLRSDAPAFGGTALASAPITAQETANGAYAALVEIPARTALVYRIRKD